MLRLPFLSPAALMQLALVFAMVIFVVASAAEAVAAPLPETTQTKVHMSEPALHFFDHTNRRVMGYTNEVFLHSRTVKVGKNGVLEHTRHAKSASPVLVHTRHEQTSEHDQYIIHVKYPVTQAFTHSINAMLHPYKLGSYLPHNSFHLVGPACTLRISDPDGIQICRAAIDRRTWSDFMARLHGIPGVLGVVLYEPLDKISQHLWQNMEIHADTAKKLYGPPVPAHTMAPRYYPNGTQIVEADDDDDDEGPVLPTKPVIVEAHLVDDAHLEFSASASSTASAAMDSAQALAALKAKAARWEKMLREYEVEANLVSHVNVTSRDVSTSVEVVHGQLLVIKTLPSNHMPVVSWLSHRREVHFVSRRADYRLQNEYARFVMQGDRLNQTAFWDSGLRGEGEVVTVADTGMDWDNCFFNDPNHTLPWGPGGSNFAPNMNHRKIVMYTAFASSDHEDGEAGHGSHVAGSIAGDCQSTNPSLHENLSKFNGMAPKAKLSFYDIAKVKQETHL